MHEMSHTRKLFLRPKLQIAQGRFTGSGRSVLRPLEQLTLTFEKLKVIAADRELAGGTGRGEDDDRDGFARKRPKRQTLPEHLPRETGGAATACASSVGI
jgi:hypothetical protein